MNSKQDPLESARIGTVLVGELIKAAGSDPRAKEAAGNLGSAAVTITRAINNVLLPLAAVNFAFEKARFYFEGKFQQDLANSTAEIPAENLQEPKASVAGPALQALAFTHEEESLRKMFLGLLTTAMDSRVADSAHPAFVEIIKQLDSQEAPFLLEILKSQSYSPIVMVKKAAPNGHTVLFHHLVNLRDPQTGKAKTNPRFPAMLDNWARLGLVKINYDGWLTLEESYSWVESRPDYLELKGLHESSETPISFDKGYVSVTDLGKEFARAINTQGL